MALVNLKEMLADASSKHYAVGTIYTTSSLNEEQPLVWLMVVHFTCTVISSIPQ